MRSSILVSIFFWLCVAGPSVAFAAGGPSATPAAQRAAREAFQRGERAFKAEDFARALDAFQEAFAAVSHDAVRFNIAVCLERLGRPSEALEQYEAAAKSDMLDEKDRERARRSADAARAALGTISVKDGEAGTAVSVDGTERCKVPCQVALDPGPHRVQIGSNAAVNLDVERGREHVLMAPAPPPPTPKPAAKPAPKPIAKPAPKKVVTERRGPSWLTWTGGALVVAGGASTTYFGLRTRSLHDDYVREPTQDRYDEGRRDKLITNVSIGVAAVGAALIVVDLLFLAPEPRERVEGARAPSAGFEF